MYKSLSLEEAKVAVADFVARLAAIGAEVELVQGIPTQATLDACCAYLKPRDISITGESLFKAATTACVDVIDWRQRPKSKPVQSYQDSRETNRQRPSNTGAADEVISLNRAAQEIAAHEAHQREQVEWFGPLESFITTWRSPSSGGRNHAATTRGREALRAEMTRLRNIKPRLPGAVVSAKLKEFERGLK
jgi:hypothetical protein